VKEQYLDEIMADFKKNEPKRKKTLREMMAPLYSVEDMDEDEVKLGQEVLERSVDISFNAFTEVAREVYDNTYTEEELRIILECRKKYPWMSEKSDIVDHETRKRLEIAAAPHVAALKEEFADRLEALD
jgi:hypothetical protein